jgi:hypothetical protein
MAERTVRSHNVADLILTAAVLAAVAEGIATTWVDDGEGTCGALLLAA